MNGAKHFIDNFTITPTMYLTAAAMLAILAVREARAWCRDNYENVAVIVVYLLILSPIIAALWRP